jgi:hypothetical protein
VRQINRKNPEALGRNKKGGKKSKCLILWYGWDLYVDRTIIIWTCIWPQLPLNS